MAKQSDWAWMVFVAAIPHKCWTPNKTFLCAESPQPLLLLHCLAAAVGFPLLVLQGVQAGMGEVCAVVPSCSRDGRVRHCLFMKFPECQNRSYALFPSTRSQDNGEGYWYRPSGTSALHFILERAFTISDLISWAGKENSKRELSSQHRSKQLTLI